MELIKVAKKESKVRGDDYYSYPFGLCMRISLVLSITLIAYFSVMRYFNLHEILSFRYFNFVFLFIGILIAFYQYRKKYSNTGIDYFLGLKMGFHISLMAVIPFAIFMEIYLEIDKNFMSLIKSDADYGSFLTPIVTAGSLLFEGLGSGLIITFITIQYFKKSNFLYKK